MREVGPGDQNSWGRGLLSPREERVGDSVCEKRILGAKRRAKTETQLVQVLGVRGGRDWVSDLRAAGIESLVLSSCPLPQSPCPSCPCSLRLRRPRREKRDSGCAAWGGGRVAGS